ncbi:LAGLIDADG family homing endonuclease [Streptomyces sp. NPDC000963]
MAEQDPSAPALFDLGALTHTAPPSSFMDLEDPGYAYMFGFLQADGHLSSQSRQRGRLTVEINARDIQILREFQQLTPYNSSITERTRATNFSKSHHSAIWTLSSLEARTTLNRLGLPYGKKSKKITPPRVPFSRRDYLRGVIDADGSVGFTGQGFPFVSLTTSSTAVGAYLCHYTKKITGTERQIKRNTRDGVYNVVYTKEAAVQLAAHLYYPDCLALERKRTNAEGLGAWVRPEDMRVSSHRRWKTSEDRVLLAHGNAVAAAGELGRTEQSCSLRLWRLKTGRAPMPAERPMYL